MTPTMSSSVNKKAQKRPMSFEEQLAAADMPITKRPRVVAKPAAPVQKPEDGPVESQKVEQQVVEDLFHDPTAGRKSGHCAGLGRPVQTKKPLGDLKDRTVRELELLFHYNKKVREKQDHIWKDVAEREFSIKLEKREDESWYSFFKRTESAEEARLAELASRISAKQQKAKAEEKKTKVCNKVAPQRRRARATAATIHPREKINRKAEKKQGPTPLMKKAMKMAKAMRR